MPTTRVHAYEAMFLLSQATAANLADALAHIEELLSRARADVLAISKWGERRLAYEIGGQRRGVFLLVYFKAPTDAIAGLERDAVLSEKILRALIVRADHYTEEQMRATDAREQLRTEARLRAAARQDDARDQPGVSLGAPDASRHEPQPASAGELE